MDGSAFRIGDSMRLVFMSPMLRQTIHGTFPDLRTAPDLASTLPFSGTQVGSPAMRFEIGCIDHDRLALGTLGSQTHHDPGEDPIVAPPLPTVIKRLRRTILFGRIAPSQPVAVDEDYAAEHTAIVGARLAMALGK